MPRCRLVLSLMLIAAACSASQPPVAQVAVAPIDAEAEAYRADALSIEPLINRVYAYLDRFADGTMPMSDRLRSEAAAVSDRRSLLRYAERALLALADHHAITGASFADSWAVVPSYADLWVVLRDGDFVVEVVRDDSPAALAGIRAGDRLVGVDGMSTGQSVAAFWDDLGLPLTDERAEFAARVLAAGRRDRSRRLTLQRGAAAARTLVLPSLYAVTAPERPPLSSSSLATEIVIRFNDSLGRPETIAAFDAAMAGAGSRAVVIDLRDTPSGGNTTVARAVLGWFVRRPTAYQIHSLPAEERATGIARRWIELVLPRTGKHHDGPVRVLVGRWTGSMGEGMAIGFDALGMPVTGTRMAGLLGAIYDQRLEHSGLILKLPTERLEAVDGTPRERFVPGAPARH